MSCNNFFWTDICTVYTFVWIFMLPLWGEGGGVLTGNKICSVKYSKSWLLPCYNNIYCRVENNHISKIMNRQHQFCWRKNRDSKGCTVHGHVPAWEGCRQWSCACVCICMCVFTGTVVMCPGCMVQWSDACVREAVRFVSNWHTCSVDAWRRHH